MAKAFEKDDFFKIDPECHLVGDMKPIQHHKNRADICLPDGC